MDGASPNPNPLEPGSGRDPRTGRRFAVAALVVLVLALALLLWSSGAFPDAADRPSGEGPPALLVVVGLLVFFPAFWSFVCWLLALGGWRRLAAAYPDAAIAGVAYRLRSGRVGGTNYNGVLRIDASDRGLRFAVMPLFRPGHPPFFVPWSDVAVDSRRRLFASTVRLTFARVPRAPLEISPGLGERLLAGRP